MLCVSFFTNVPTRQPCNTYYPCMLRANGDIDSSGSGGNEDWDNSRGHHACIDSCALSSCVHVFNHHGQPSRYVCVYRDHCYVYVCVYPSPFVIVIVTFLCLCHCYRHVMHRQSMSSFGVDVCVLPLSSLLSVHHTQLRHYHSSVPISSSSLSLPLLCSSMVLFVAPCLWCV